MKEVIMVLVHKNSGFSLVETVVLLMVFGVVSLLGIRVYYADKTTDYTAIPQVTTKSTAKRVVVLADIACTPEDEHFAGQKPERCQHEKIAGLVKAQKPDAIIMPGDLQYEKGAPEAFRAAFDKTFGQFKDITYPAPGNHEYYTEGATGYYGYFSDIPVDVSKGYYNFSVGNWDVVSLNSNCEHIDGCDAQSDQVKWLVQELENQKSRCSIAFWHHPHFTSGKYSDDVESGRRSSVFWELLDKSNTDIVLNGHDHLYERFSTQTATGDADENGIRQFTVGTGGKSMYKTKRVAANSEKIIDNTYGVLVLDLNASSYDWSFVSIDGQVLDSGSDTCR